MTNLLRRNDMPSSYSLFLYSDVHVGAKAFHQEAFEQMINEIRRKKNAYAICLGDLVEGQTVDHPHYNHDAVTHSDAYDLHRPEGQYQMFSDLIEPIANKHIGILLGNHDWRFRRVKHFVRDLCKDLDTTYLGPKAHVMLNDNNFFLAHKGRMLTNNAGSPAQLRANREESLRRFFTRPRDYWASAHYMAHGDTHQLLVAKPVKKEPQLMTSKDGTHRMRNINVSIGEGTTEDGFVYVPPDARWYAVTGTFRRGGDIIDVTNDGGADAWEDYSDEANYSPNTIGYVKVEVKNDKIVDSYEVTV